MKDHHTAQFSSLSVIINPSYTLAFLFGMLGSFALLCLIYLPVDIEVKCLIALLVISVITYMIRLHTFLNMPNSVRELTLNPKGEWSIKRHDGRIEPVTFDGTSFVAAYAAVINLKVRNQKGLTSVLLIPSRVDAQVFRRLRILLKWTKAAVLIES